MFFDFLKFIFWYLVSKSVSSTVIQSLKMTLRLALKNFLKTIDFVLPVSRLYFLATILSFLAAHDYLFR